MIHRSCKECAWRGDRRALLIHQIKAHGKASKKAVESRLRNTADIGFFIAMNPPSFEEVFRLSEFHNHLLFDTSSNFESWKLKEHYRDNIRGITKSGYPQRLGRIRNLK